MRGRVGCDELLSSDTCPGALPHLSARHVSTPPSDHSLSPWWLEMEEEEGWGRRRHSIKSQAVPRPAKVREAKGVVQGCALT